MTTPTLAQRQSADLAEAQKAANDAATLEATRVAVNNLVIARFATLFGEPNTEDNKAFADEYRKAMKFCTPVRIEKAIDRVIANHTYPSWPTVGECMDAYRAIIHDVESANERRLASAPPPVKEPPLPDSRERVAKMQAECIAFLQSVAWTSKIPDELPPVDSASFAARQRELREAGLYRLSRYEAPGYSLTAILNEAAHRRVKPAA